MVHLNELQLIKLYWLVSTYNLLKFNFDAVLALPKTKKLPDISFKSVEYYE